MSKKKKIRGGTTSSWGVHKKNFAALTLSYAPVHIHGVFFIYIFRRPFYFHLWDKHISEVAWMTKYIQIQDFFKKIHYLRDWNDKNNHAHFLIRYLLIYCGFYLHKKDEASKTTFNCWNKYHLGWIWYFAVKVCNLKNKCFWNKF